MNILIIDAQGGGIGRQLVAAIRERLPEASLTAVGTNSAATSAMLKAGATQAATGENAVVVSSRRADVIIGPIGIVIADALLGEISDLRRSGASEAQTDFSHDLLSANDYYQTPGWLLRDLDGDGTSELLLGADWGDGYGVIFNIYRLDGAQAVRVVDGWNRSRWYLCTDGSLANEGSSSAFESSYSYYRYTSGELQHLETLLYLDDGSGGSPWRYSVTTDQYVNSGDFHSVTEAEATAVMDKYTHETLILTPFVV